MIVFAVNIHTGGGKILLDELIQSEPFGSVQYLFLDQRYTYTPQPHHKYVRFYPPTLFGRIKAQYELKKFMNNLSEQQEILFFGNWPPFFKMAANSIVYLQNCFLLSGVPFPKFSFKEKFRNLVERYMLKIFSQNYQQIWVQTEWMSELTKRNFPKKLILKKPFLPSMPKPDHQILKEYDFITVTSLSPHKNFNVFTEALKILDNLVNRKINVLVVLDASASAQSVKLPPFKNIGIEIKNRVTRDELFMLYQKSRLAVVTSSYESFCLPLYEAKFYGLTLIGPNESYVKEASDNVNTYPTYSADALSECLKGLIE